jgi:hypothetical protein
VTSGELRAWIESHGWTHQALADEIGVTKRALEFWLSGRYPVPTWLPTVLDGPPIAQRRPTNRARTGR